MTHVQNQTILLAEDDRSAREVTALVLEAEGYRVLTSSNGTGALDILLHDATIDLLLSDIHMRGGIDGIERRKQGIEALHFTDQRFAVRDDSIRHIDAGRCIRDGR